MPTKHYFYMSFKTEQQVEEKQISDHYLGSSSLKGIKELTLIFLRSRHPTFANNWAFGSFVCQS